VKDEDLNPSADGPVATRLLIVGYGAFARAFHGALATRSDIEVSVFSRSPRTFDHDVARVISRPADLSLGEFDIVVVAVPSHAVGEVLGGQTGRIPESTAFVSCVKGMDAASARFPSEVIYASTGSSFIAVISGASFADEMLAGHPVFLTFACANAELGRQVADQLRTGSLHFELTTDVRGLEVAGVGKNIIALGAGMGDGLELGENFRASFIARGVVELGRVARLLGGDERTVVSAGALADFFLTCSSPKSRNYMHGRRLAQGEQQPDALAEGFRSAESFVAKLRTHRIGSPYFDTILESLTNPRAIVGALQSTEGN
jgi:glycerol-3-phosphate dehydrogenase (NAD(P)+)